MSETINLDPNDGLEVVDAQVNVPVETDGRNDTSSRDKIRITINDTLRAVSVAARNEDETGDAIPLKIAGAIPDFTVAYTESNDFDHFDAGDDFVVTQASAGTADVIDGFGGILELDAASSTADQGVQVQHKTETVKLAAGRLVVFECKLKVTDTIDKAQVFAGLSVLDTSIIASGEMSASDYVGFVMDATKQAGASAGKLDLELNSTSGSEEQSEDAATLVEDTYIRLGFIIDGITSVTPFVDGVLGTAITISSAPTTEMSVSFVCQSEGTNDPIVSLDWYNLFCTR